MGEEISTTKADDEQAYELDLEEHTSSDLEGAFEEAVAAVARGDDAGEGMAEEDAVGADASDEETEDGASRAELEEKLQRVAAERDSLRDRLQRTLAEMDNFRKRTEREKKSLARMGHFDVVKDFLGVIDNLERAMAASGSIEDLKQGLELVMRQQGEILKRHGVETVESVGQPFDPTVHEAVLREESDEVDTPTVSDELQRGYLLYDRLLRPAMVRVAVPSTSAAGAAEDSVADGDGGEGESEE